MRRIALAALGMTMSVMTGCSSLDSIGPNGSVAGTYTLVRLNGQLLPYTFSTGVTLVSDDLSLRSDGSYIDVSRYASGNTITQEGFYDNTNGSLYFEPDANIAPFQGSVNGDVLTVIANGYTQTFARR
jgi:hypothetical protein